MEFTPHKIRSWTEFTALVSQLPGEWVYRGQSQDWPLTTSLERVLTDWDVELTEGPAVERQMIRDFRRQYRGNDQARVSSDTLYCLALMQHYGAPTRLLDWTYSPFVAAKFAIQKGARESVVWCLNTAWCYRAAVKIVGEADIRARNTDASRDDTTFLPLYMPERNRLQFVFPENPLHLNERLIIQQGVFLCSADAGAAFVDNLKGMEGWNSSENVLKVQPTMDKRELARFAIALRRMNVDSAVLFPGLDGFARSLKERLPLYVDLARRSIGGPDHKTGSTI